MMTFDASHQPTTLELAIIAAVLSGIIFWYGWYFRDTIKEMERFIRENNIKHDDLD